MDTAEVESHPWEPFIPEHSRVLILGTFPPGRHRWSMEFYYPNKTNDFWKICGLLFYGDKDALYNVSTKSFCLESIQDFLTVNHIALHDTARKIRRLKGNASDKYLEIVEPLPLQEILGQMPECHTIATTGEKAAGVISSLTGTPIPRMGEMINDNNGLNIWRMPSTSRAYPLPLEQKASYYKELFQSVGIL